MSSVITEPPERSNPYSERIKLVLGDITYQDTDSILTIIPQNLEYKGSLNDSIREAAGEDLEIFLQENVINPRPSDIYAIPGFTLPCDHIFFCIIPVWRTEFDRRDKFLLYAARKALELSFDMGLRSVSIPFIGAGKNGFPKQRAARLISQGIQERLYEGLKEVRIVCPDADDLALFEGRF
ncbi:MAG: macro domain-containing protein [Alphaproteobacteria bacterium]|nr:macro domain-containing protein [Alphaproteobacteria bacterium]